ncbi:MAG: protease modulator HflC [Alphaproteobacteria bacterium CG_4_10_14_0_2_um_filter_63_37]|nr:MAG: HflC protein [Proteobacteria bacterium CG1_02_64_396]PJA24383.1 MAG: protease modulator HflC [Alphaproteobacteria bacterium CG_4_10_14_0_2_um_filter_63_37]
MNKGLSVLTGILSAVILIAGFTLFTVKETEQVLVLQMGKPVKALTEPGLQFKIPFIQNILTFDRRILEYDSDPAEVLTLDKKNLVVDHFTKWRIVDPLKLFQTVQNEVGAISRLDDIIYSRLREELGKHTFEDIVSGVRTQLMDAVRESCNEQAAPFGIEVVDVRIKRTDLPKENSDAVFRRMQTERQRMAKQYRSEGAEEAQKIRADADRQKTEIISEAYRDAQILRGEGDATAIKTYGEAFSKDEKFFEFMRTLEAYKKIFKDGGRDRMVLSTDSPLLKLLTGQEGAARR